MTVDLERLLKYTMPPAILLEAVRRARPQTAALDRPWRFVGVFDHRKAASIQSPCPCPAGEVVDLPAIQVQVAPWEYTQFWLGACGQCKTVYWAGAE